MFSSFLSRFRSARSARFLGFTLVELLVVVVVIGVLAGIALVKYEGQKEKAYQAAMINDVRNFAILAETYGADHGYVAPEALPGFKYTKNDTTMGFSTSGNAWSLLVSNPNSKTVCGAQSIPGTSIRPACGVPTDTGIVASNPSGPTVTFDITGYLAQVAIAAPSENGPFTPTSLQAVSDFSNATIVGWDFGDSTGVSGPPATTAIVSHTYAKAGNYTVKAGIIGASGKVYSAKIKSNVTTGSGSTGGTGGGTSTNKPPVAAFSVSANPVVAGTATSFDASGSTDSDGTVVAYAWSFGDSQTGTGQTATHTYATAGNYTVTLTVTDNQGATNSIAQGVTVTAPVDNYTPAANFTASPSTGVIAGQAVSFVAATDARIASYAWNFGDGQTGTGSTVSHSYASASTYTVSLTETATNGHTGHRPMNMTVAAATPPTATASVSPSTTLEPNQTASFTGTGTANASGATISSYAWDFGDFSSGTGATASHAYAAGTWNAVLTVTDSYGLTGTANVNMTVAAPTATQFSGPTTTLANQSSTFASAFQDNNGYPFTSTDWDFGDGTAHDASSNPRHTYTTAGTRTITLTLTNSLGNTVVQTGTMTVSNGTPPSSAFTTAVSYPDKGTSIQFNAYQSHANNSGGSITSYDWDWGDATVGTGILPSHAFAAAGNYTVSLKVTDNLGLTNTSAQTITVVAPVAAISGNSTVMTGQAITFTSTSTSPGSAIQNYSWSTSGVAASPATSAGSSATSFTTTFSAAGTAAVKLVITDASGTTDSTTKNVTVTAAAAPTVSLAASTTTPEPGQPVTLTATATSNNGGTITTYHYDYGDGIVKDTTASVITHTYTAGTWSATVKATDNYGASATSSAQAMTVAAPTATQFTGPTTTLANQSSTFASAFQDNNGYPFTSTDWDFGDGTAHDASSNPRHTYTTAGTRTVTLTLTNSLGNTVVQTGTVTVSNGTPPSSVFTTSVSYPDKGTSIQFNAYQSHANNSGGSIVSYDWDWGDATVGTGILPSHAFAAAGNYTVSLKVTDNLGLTNTSAQTITVVAPVAAISGNSTVMTGQAITFTSTSTSPGSAIQNYSWSTSGVAASPATSAGSSATSFTTTFSAAGTAAVKLVITDASGTTDSTTKTVTVTAGAAPTVTFTADKTTPEPSEAVTFTMSATSNNPGGSFNTYHYDYGDGITADVSAHTVTHAYTAGTWVASVTATDNYGGSTTKTVTITVGTPSVAIAMTGGSSANATYKGRSNSFSMTSNTFHGSVSSYTWAWGDGTANTLTAAPTHTFTTAGTPTVALTATDSYGATATASLGVTVAAGAAPTASFTVTPANDTLTTAQSVTVNASGSHSNNTGGSIASYSWTFGDGHTATGATPASYQYAAAGNYTITLTVTDDLGLTATSTAAITVNTVSAGAAPPTGQALRFRADQGVTASNWTDISDSGTVINGGAHAVLHQTSGGNLVVGSGTSNSHTSAAVVATPMTFTTTLSGLASTTGTVVIVATYSNTTSYLMYSNSGTSGFYLNPGATNQEIGAAKSGGTSFVDVATSGISAVNATTWVYTNDGSTATATIGGVTVTKTGTYPSPLNAGSNWHIGSYSDGSSQFSGKIYEIIVYRRVLSGADMTTLNSYLTSRY